MIKTTPIYDDTIEKQLNALICKLDDNPIISTSPVEASSYLGFTMADTEKGFMKYIKENLFDKFIAYIESYKTDCINAYSVGSHFIPVIKRIIKKYDEAINNHYSAEVRTAWERYINEPVNQDAETVQINQVYQFFHRAAGVQIFYLGMVRERLSKHLLELDTVVYKPEPEYYFSIQPEFRIQRHNILYDIHKNLKAEGYIDCTPDAFKNVFTIKEPKSLKWFKSQRSLTYLIKILSEQFLEKKDKPSNYYIAERYFHIYKNGVLFQPKKLRHDDNPSLNDKDFLDKVVNDSISAFK